MLMRTSMRNDELPPKVSRKCPGRWFYACCGLSGCPCVTRVSSPTVRSDSPGTTADSSRRGSIAFWSEPMPAHPVPSRESIESWLSRPRFARYLEAARGNDAKALEFYLWNTGLAQAVLRDVSFFEVALRNSYCRALDKFWLGHGRWLFDDDSPIRRPILRTNKRGNVTDANRINRYSIDRLRDSLGSSASPDRIISNLTLGFWAHMSDRNHERDVWIPILHRVWPKGTSRSALNKCVTNINAVRNRAAYNEHLFEVNGGHCLTSENASDRRIVLQTQSISCM